MGMTFEYDDEGPIRKVIATWTSDGAQLASGTTKKLGGFLIKGQTNPGAVAPSDNYNVIVTDDDGVNVLGNSHDDLLARDTANTEEVYFNIQASATNTAAYPAFNSPLTISVSAAGAAKDGVVTLFYLKPW